MGHRTGEARHRLEMLFRAGSGSLRAVDEDTRERLRAYVRWVYRSSWPDEQARWGQQAEEVFQAVARGEELGEQWERRRTRADRYYAQVGGPVVGDDLAAAKRLWIMCYEMAMTWVKIDGKAVSNGPTGVSSSARR